MEVGQVTEQIEVQANATLVETRNVGVGQVIENERILELPLNGRRLLISRWLIRTETLIPPQFLEVSVEPFKHRTASKPST